MNGTHALVLGLGDSGLAMARFLAARGAIVHVADTRLNPPHLDALRSELPQVRFTGGEFLPSLLEDVQMVALSPGLSPTESAAAPLVEAAITGKLDVVGEIELFARELTHLKAERNYAPKVIGVTGTNGKTTTTRLVGQMINATGQRAEVAGNISPAALDALQAGLIANDLPDVWVLELSSFQLATTRSLECDAAAILNISEDHLDWHSTMESYVSAKKRIFSARTIQVLNRDDTLISAMATRATGAATFGTGAPTRGNAYGIVLDHGVAWLAWAEDLTAPSRRKKGVEQAPPDLLMHRLMPVEALAIRGAHNASNALAAIALARAIGCPLGPMMHALRRYQGEPHRLQLIETIDGVEYYDDSKGTNVGATVAAIEGMSTNGRKLVVILGGDGKGQNFAPLVKPLMNHARAVVLIGRDAPLIRRAFEGGPTEALLVEAESLESAVVIAAEHAVASDAVLLSPACASFDMFRNYVHRGQAFAAAVRELAEAPQPC